MTIKNLSTRETFVLLFAPLLLLSRLIVIELPQNMYVVSFVYLTRPLFMGLLLFVAFYAITASTVIEKIMSQSNVWAKRLVTFLFVSLSIYYVSMFHRQSLDTSLFFLEVFALNLGVNIILCLLISKIISSRLTS